MASKIPRNMTSKNTQDPLNSKLQNPHPPSLHDTTEIPRPKPEKVSHAVGYSACDTVRAQARKKKAHVAHISHPLLSISGHSLGMTANGCVQREGAKCARHGRHPGAGVASAAWAPPTLGHQPVARSPQPTRRSAYGEFKKCFLHVASHWICFRMLPRIGSVFACCLALDLFW
jgi:hypothetical protein